MAASEEREGSFRIESTRSESPTAGTRVCLFRVRDVCAGCFTLDAAAPVDGVRDKPHDFIAHPFVERQKLSLQRGDFISAEHFGHRRPDSATDNRGLGKFVA